MDNFEDDVFEWDEQPDEYDLEYPEYDVEEIPDVNWAEDIGNIENPILRERAIETAKKLVDKENELNAKIESGEMSTFQAECAFSDLRKEKAAASTRAGLASVGLTYDHLAEASEAYDILTTGDYKLIDLIGQVRKMAERIGPEKAQHLADEMLKKGKISEPAHEHISRQVRLSSLK